MEVGLRDTWPDGCLRFARARCFLSELVPLPSSNGEHEVKSMLTWFSPAMLQDPSSWEQSWKEHVLADSVWFAWAMTEVRSHQIHCPGMGTYLWDFLAQKWGEGVSCQISSGAPGEIIEPLWWGMAGLRAFQQRTKSWGCGPRWHAWRHAESEQQRPALNPADFQNRLAFNVHPAAFLVKWSPCFKKQRELICWSVPLRVQLPACSCCSNCDTEMSSEIGKNASLG